MLFDGGEEMVRRLFREDHGLPAEGAHFGAADVKHVAEPRQFRQRYVAGGAGEAIAQTGAIDEKGQLKMPADAADAQQFLL